jgi:hypothetical protein
MSGNHILEFHQDKEGALLLPKRCSVSVTCDLTKEVQRPIVSMIEESLYALALSGMNLRALDGVTVALDARTAACKLQNIPDGLLPTEMTDHPETMELARTVAVRCGDEFRFHIVLRAGLALMALSSEPEQQRLASGCIAHEAAHVQHEGHLYKTFPDMYGGELECGNRSKQMFLKAFDVWSEYAACRSSAIYRPEALADFDRVFCRAFETSGSVAEKWVASHQDGGRVVDASREIQQAFGDAFVSTGYLLGHLHGLELKISDDVPGSRRFLAENSEVSELVDQLDQILNGLWLSEFAWASLDVFAPIYELLCELMALHGMALAHNDQEWQIVPSR